MKDQKTFVDRIEEKLSLETLLIYIYFKIRDPISSWFDALH